MLILCQKMSSEAQWHCRKNLKSCPSEHPELQLSFKASLPQVNIFLLISFLDYSCCYCFLLLSTNISTRKLIVVVVVSFFPSPTVQWGYTAGCTSVLAFWTSENWLWVALGTCNITTQSVSCWSWRGIWKAEIRLSEVTLKKHKWFGLIMSKFSLFLCRKACCDSPLQVSHSWFLDKSLISTPGVKTWPPGWKPGILTARAHGSYT